MVACKLVSHADFFRTDFFQAEQSMVWKWFPKGTQKDQGVLGGQPFPR